MFYIVGTPIGNLEDLSIRQAKIISEVDIILTEDTRSTGILLTQISKLFGFTRNKFQKLISYYKEKEFEKLPYVLELIEQNKTIALITESGMPLISDPGYLLVNEMVKRKIPFTVVPGPTAAITALVHSGFNPSRFIFFGFLSKKRNDVIKEFKQAANISKILKNPSCIFYESGNRMHKTLDILYSFYPNSTICICRELTKKFEEILRGNAKDLMNANFKGEIVLIISFI